MTYSDRLKQARKYAGLTQPALAEKLNGLMTQQNISLLENGVIRGSELTVQLANACGVSPEWLATGKGEMLIVNYTLTSQQEKVLQAMQNMQPYEQDALVKISNSLVEPKANGTK